MRFKTGLLGLAAGVLAIATSAFAAEQRPFDAKAFAAAQQQNRPILVDVYADWCPTCKAQAPILNQAIQAPEFKNLLVLKLNFDTQKPDWVALGVRRQSTLIAFRGTKETGRSIGDTNPQSIATLVGTTVR
jgi:thiol:disulfide interchange protein